MEKKLCKNWTTATELGSVVSRSLIKLTREHPAVGWVQADNIPEENASLEILKLQKRIEELEGELAVFRTAPPGTEEFAQGEDELEIEISFTVEVPGVTFGGHIYKYSIPISFCIK